LSSGACNFAQVFEEEQQEIARQCAAREVTVDLEFDGRPGTPVPDRLGIAFSGGGIRSACVGIGVMQRLAKAGILKQAHYLSGISGGTYAMSWLTAWTMRLRDFSIVQGCLGNNTNNGLPPEADASPKYSRFLEPDPLHYLRRYSSYLTPRMGLFSGDTFAAISIYLRNLLLNQVMLVAALVSVTIMLQQITPTIGWASAFDKCWLVVGVSITILLFGVAAVLVWRALARLPESSTPGKKYPAYVAMSCAWGIACLIWLMTPSWYVTHPAALATDWVVLGLGCVGFVVSSALGARTKNSSVEKGNATRVLALAFAWAGAGGMVCLVDLAFRAWLIASGSVYVTTSYVILALPAILAATALVSYLFIGLLGNALPDSQREWLARLTAYLLAFAIVTAIVLGVVLEGPVFVSLLLHGLLQPAWKTKILAAILPGGWLFVVVSGLIGGKSAKTPSTGADASSRGLDFVVGIAPSVFLAGLLMLVSWGTHALVLAAKGSTPHAEYLTSAMWCPAKPPAAPPACASAKSCPATSPTAPAICWRAPIFASYNLTGQAAPATSKAREYLRNHPFLILWAMATILALLLGWRLDVNEFSMNLFYRNRLVRTFLGASNKTRKPSLFTGFASDDDVALKDLTFDNSFEGPYPIWGTTLNLTAGEDLAWQQRKGASFIYSPLFCGWDYVDSVTKPAQPESPTTDEDTQAVKRPAEANLFGYRRTGPKNGTLGYGGAGGAPYIGTAMAASGAAASPNMGFHTKPGVAALLAIFNVRLGFWTGNPRNPRTWNRYAPGIWYLVSELLGRANADDHYVYLSDGGHFENLGLYELVRRKVRFIICSDADSDADFTFGDLGNAVERCRADFGVEIRIKAQLDMKLQKEPPFRIAHYAIGTIDYPGQPSGILLYLKSSLTNDEPSDVLGKRASDSAFPHDTTADQFFEETMFEAYRALGDHMVDVMLTDNQLNVPPGSQRNMVVDLFTALRAKTSAIKPA
jgi:Lysophospholipase catalytic domain